MHNICTCIVFYRAPRASPFPQNRTKPDEIERNRAIIVVKCVTKMYQIAIYCLPFVQGVTQGPSHSMRHLRRIARVCFQAWTVFGDYDYYAASAAIRLSIESYCPPTRQARLLSNPLTSIIRGRRVSDTPTLHWP